MSKLKVDMTGILDAMRSGADSTTHYLNRRTGEVDFRVDDDDFADCGDGDGDGDGEDFSNEDTWAEIPALTSREGYDLMASFAETVQEEDVREMLDTALHGAGAFRRFRDVVRRFPDVEARWRKFERDQLERDAHVGPPLR